MAISLNGKKRIRKTFGRIPEVAPMPNLIEVQRTSYEHFLQMDTRPEERASVGLQEVFKSVFPIRDFSERAQLEFVRYELETPKYDVDECQQRGITFAAPLKVTLVENAAVAGRGLPPAFAHPAAFGAIAERHRDDIGRLVADAQIGMGGDGRPEEKSTGKNGQKHRAEVETVHKRAIGHGKYRDSLSR